MLSQYDEMWVFKDDVLFMQLIQRLKIYLVLQSSNQKFLLIMLIHT